MTLRDSTHVYMLQFSLKCAREGRGGDGENTVVRGAVVLTYSLPHATR